MTAREWKPGVVAIVSDDNGNERVAVRGELNPRQMHRWHYDESGIGRLAADARPLVVIDPEDREQVERLAGLLHDPVDHVQSCLRATLAPPRPAEPGLWAVVEATVDGIPRRRWVHHEEDRWVCDTGERRYWEDLIDPTLVREGVTA